MQSKWIQQGKTILFDLRTRKAEQKRDQIHSYGRIRGFPARWASMAAIVEPATG